jgi:ABC-type uncharacterized transport system ATPase subunit
MVYQHFTLVPCLTAAENMVISRADAPAVINWAREKEDLKAFMERMPFRVPLNTVAADLSAGEKQKLEILKQLYLNQRFLILDEPTSVLTPGEADEILGLLHDMARAGDITVLMITHKFREVNAFADRVTVLRRGKLAGSGSVKDLSTDDMSKMMIGEAQMRKRPSDWRGSNPRARLRSPASVSMTMKACGRSTLSTSRSAGGEIVGIAGVSGNGQSELVEALAGQRSLADGAVIVNGKAL